LKKELLLNNWSKSYIKLWTSWKEYEKLHKRRNSVDTCGCFFFVI